MPQDGCCCISPSIDICLLRCSWDQSFVDNTLVKTSLPCGPLRPVMDPSRAMDHCYQNVDPIKDTSHSVRIPLGTEWDPVKIPKDLVTISTVVHTPDGSSSDPTPVRQIISDKSVTDDETLKARNSLSTVVRRAHPRPFGSDIISPPRSPSLRSPRSFVIDTSEIDSLVSAPPTPSYSVKSPVSQNMDTLVSSTDCERRGSTRSPHHVYQNSSSHFFTDSCGARQATPQPSIAIRTHESVNSPADSLRISTDGACSRKTSTGGEDSGLSSSGSDAISSRLSPLSVCSEVQTDQTSDTSSVGLPVDLSSLLDNRSPRVLDNTRATEPCPLTSQSGVRVCVPRHHSDISSHMTSRTLVNDCVSTQMSNLELSRHQLTSCPFYVGKMSADEARDCLLSFPVGTFLVRDSSDARFVYSISVQTTHGPTSIRVGYQSERFHLDSEPHQIDTIPMFTTVLELVTFYVRLNAPRTNSGKKMVLVEMSKHRDCPVVLLRPYVPHVTSLMHTCRRVINQQLDGRSSHRLCLIPSLKDYLNNYPYDL